MPHIGPSGGDGVSIYVVLSRLTDEGRKSLKHKPERLKEVNEEVNRMGAKLLHQWALLGRWDFLNIIEAPDNGTIAKVLVELGSRGTVETNSTVAMPVDEFLDKLKE